LRNQILSIVENLIPFDELEAKHRSQALKWIGSDVELFRTQKPATPNPHLVSYFVLVDFDANKILLVDHKKAQLWLPSGGHVEPDEHPKATVERECFEELGITADFWIDEPVFITITETVGLTAGHTDVSLWYVLKGKSADAITFDKDEFVTIQWFALDKVPYERTEPHLKRFMHKLNSHLYR
jgi:8-oxo-dGTP diphosphatase